MAAITAAVIAAGATAYSVSASNKNSKKQIASQQAIADQNNSAAYGSKVKPVKYETLWNNDPGYRSTSQQVIAGDQANLPAASRLSADTNAAITASSKARVNGFDPTFIASLNQLYQNRNNELQGNLPYDDAMAAMASRNRQANDNGQAGGSTPQVAADLGLSRLDLMNQGASLSERITSILNGIDPVARYSTPQDYQITPAQAVPWQIADNQFSAQFKSQQNALAAMADPAAAGALNMQAFQAGLQGQGGNNNAQAYASYAKIGAGLLSAYGSSGGSTGGSWGNSNSGMNYTGSAASTQAAQNGGYNAFTGNGIDSGTMYSEGASAPAGVG